MHACLGRRPLKAAMIIAIRYLLKEYFIMCLCVFSKTIH